MLDIKVIRENPDKVNELLKRRNPELSIDEVIDVDKQRREVQTKADNLRAERKNTSQEIGKLIKEGQDTSFIQEKVRQLGEEIKQLEVLEAELNETQRSVLLNIPNVPHETTPVGLSETENIVIKTVGEVPKPSFKIKPHWEIGLILELLILSVALRLPNQDLLFIKALAQGWKEQ